MIRRKAERSTGKNSVGHLAGICEFHHEFYVHDNQCAKRHGSDANLNPWHDDHVNMIGPWTIPVKGNDDQKFMALTSLDPVFNLLEIIQVPNKRTRVFSQEDRPTNKQTNRQTDRQTDRLTIK